MAGFSDYKNTLFTPYILPVIPKGEPLAATCTIKPDSIGKIPGTRDAAAGDQPDEGATLAFSKAQARKLLDLSVEDTIAGLRDCAILSVGLQVGLRRAEIAALTVGDLHQNRGYDSLRVMRKGGRRDALAINPQTAARLRAYLDAASFSYQAQSWTKSRRVVAKVEWHPGELYPHVGFIVTNLARPAERVVAFYNQRGTAENWIKEGKGAIKWTRLSCRTFAANAVRLQLHALAYDLGNFMRTLAMPKAVEPWSLMSLREKLIKIGAKVVSHGRYVTFQMAEVAVPQLMFRHILMLIARLRAPPVSA